MASLSFSYLTTRQQQVFNRLDPELQDVLKGWVDYDITKARHILTTFEKSELRHHCTATKFFLKMVKSPASGQIYSRFMKIYDEGELNPFFSFAETRSFRNLSAVMNSFGTLKQSSTQERPTWASFCQDLPAIVCQRESVIACFKHFAPSSTVQENMEFVKQLKFIHVHYGEEFFLAITQTIVEKQRSFHDAIWLLKRLQVVEKKPPLSEIDAFVQHKISWEQLASVLSEIDVEEEPWALGEAELAALIQRFAEKPFPLKPEHLEEIKNSYLQVMDYCREYSALGIETLAKSARECATMQMSEREKQSRVLALGVCALRHHFHIRMHPTQVMAVLGMLLFQGDGGSLAEVKTGEGKSMIVALLALFLSNQGKRVHIISSEGSLSHRDQKHFSSFFKSFDIPTAYIKDHHPSAKAFKAQILYGTAHAFEFAIMREMLDAISLFQEEENADKRFDCVIVDEVDNLTIDTMRNEARIAARAEVSYDWVYAPILAFVRQNRRGSLEQLRVFLSEYENGIFREASLNLTNEQIEVWRGSAIRAEYVLENKNQYSVKSSSEGKSICILDVGNTGRAQTNSRWGSGVHEFLETKHAIPVKRESVTPLALSHPVYYGMYRTIFGLSGTLGNVEERREIHDIYDIGTFDVPTFAPPKRKDYEPVIVSSKEALFDNFYAEVLEMQRSGRPLLVICDTVQSSIEFSDFLESTGIDHELLNEEQEKPEEVIISQAGRPGAITVATNVASRGTDIKLSPQSIENGGLSVFTTFFPGSLRVEGQIRGRAGRQGQRGSSKIVFVSENSLQEIVEERERRTLLTRKVHVIIAELARTKFDYMRRFFDRKAQFHHSKSEIVQNLTQTWAPRRRLARAVESDLSQLRARDKSFADEAAALLADKNNQDQRWKTLIDLAHERIEKLSLENWARRFGETADKMYQESELEKLATCRNLHDSEGFRLLVDITIVGVYQKLMQDYQSLFDRGDEEGYWNTYLSKEGLNRYIKEVISGIPPKVLT